jgi:hypothetical protein
LRHEILLAFATGGKRAGWGTIQSAFSGATARKISRFLEKNSNIPSRWPLL